MKLTTRKILIVDDESDIRDVLTRVMKSLNIESAQAENGEVALALLEKEDFQGVICDIMMPVMSGLDCLARSQVAGVTTPFVFLTGYGDRDRILQAVRLGAIDFIGKPFDTHEIVEVVFRMLDIGVRRGRILNQIRAESPKLFKSIAKDEKMISLLRASNNNKKKFGVVSY